ncbi:MAG: hypothetical protein JSV99_10965 [Planctomycetota bacterium]|nr:MAG: hypothetical protein JSV99_10965 [Planctomycetota bacterium]
MKRVIIAVLVLLAVSLGLIEVFAQPPGYGGPPGYGPPGYGPPQRKRAERAERDRAKDPNSTADANGVADPNKDISKIFEGQQEALTRFNQETDKEAREWARINVDKRALARAVNEEVAAELNLLRELAVEEQAVKITAGIDALLSERQKRFEETTQKIEDAKRRQRAQQREGRRDRDRERGRDRGRNRERTREPRTRNRQGTRRGAGPPM